MNAPVFFENASSTPAAINSRRYRERHGQKAVNAYQRRWYLTPRNKARVTECNRRYRQRLADEVFAAYGGYDCACCHEIEPKFLTIDHIHGGGSEQRKTGLKGYQFYRWLKKNNFPPGFQVLCINCNLGRFRNGGVCPHQTKAA